METVFLHPGYRSPTNVLFSLPRIQRALLDENTIGVHHSTALLACQLVANNAFGGYLSRFGWTGGARVSDNDVLLVHREYYFHVPGDVNPLTEPLTDPGRVCFPALPERYAVVPTFRDWRFPHGQVPVSWPCIPPSVVYKPLCVVSGADWSLSEAHIVPRSEEEWFTRNAMSRYSPSANPGLDDEYNKVTLKVDMHQCFDALWFAFVPGLKRVPEDTDYVAFVLPGDRPLFARHFHGYYWRHTSGVAREYLLARFALAVFARMEPFLLAGPKRRLARFVTAEDGNGGQVIFEDLEREALVERYGAAAAAAAADDDDDDEASSRPAASSSANKRRRTDTAAFLPPRPPDLPIRLQPPRVGGSANTLPSHQPEQPPPVEGVQADDDDAPGPHGGEDGDDAVAEAIMVVAGGAHVPPPPDLAPPPPELRRSTRKRRKRDGG